MVWITCAFASRHLSSARKYRITAAESSIATIFNHQYDQFFTPVDLHRAEGMKLLSVGAAYFSRGHARTKARSHARPHSHVWAPCYPDTLQLPEEWVIGPFLCVCVCFLASRLLPRQLAIAILQEWTVTFDSITADWIGSPLAAGCLPSTIPCSDRSRATHRLHSPQLTPLLLSFLPVFIYLTCSHSSISPSLPFFPSPATLSRS